MDAITDGKLSVSRATNGNVCRLCFVLAQKPVLTSINTNKPCEPLED